MRQSARPPAELLNLVKLSDDGGSSRFGSCSHAAAWYGNGPLFRDLVDIPLPVQIEVGNWYVDSGNFPEELTVESGVNSLRVTLEFQKL